VLARVIFTTHRELVDHGQIAIARKKERKNIAFGKVLWSCGYHVVRNTAMLKGEGKRKTLHLGGDLCSSSFVHHCKPNQVFCVLSYYLLVFSLATEQINQL